MESMFSRTVRIIGDAGAAKLSAASVAVFGIGGVGSYAAEALIRAGVGRLLFIDMDTVDVTNLNRQLVADLETVGRFKAEVMRERALRVNPECRAEAFVRRYLPEDWDFLPSLGADFVIDAIDDVPAKAALAEECWKLGIPEAASMGTGNRLHPEMLEIADIYRTTICPLARKFRKELKARGVPKLSVVYSRELPVKPRGGGQAPGSVSFVPPAAGMILAGMAVRHLLEGGVCGEVSDRASGMGDASYRRKDTSGV